MSAMLLDLLMQWSASERTDDAQELANARAQRDAILAAHARQPLTPPPAGGIYVVLASTGGTGYSSGYDGTPKHPGGPLVMETDVGGNSTLEVARMRAAAYERRFGACRIGRVVFEDEEGRPL